MDSDRSKWARRRTHAWKCSPITRRAQRCGLLAGEIRLETARDDSYFRAARGEFIGSFAGVKFGTEEISVETARRAFLSETQYMMDFLNLMDLGSSSEGTYFRCREDVLQREFTCEHVRDDYTFAMSESYPTVGHVSEENPSRSV